MTLEEVINDAVHHPLGKASVCFSDMEEAQPSSKAEGVFSKDPSS